MQITQRHLVAGAIILMFGLVEFWVWSGLFGTVKAAVAEVKGRMPAQRKAMMDAETAAESARRAYLTRKNDWLRTYKADSGTELGRLLEASESHPEAISDRTKAVKEALQVAKSEAAMRLEVAGELDGLARRQKLAPGDRVLGRVSISADAVTGCREITAEFAFRLNRDALASLLDRKLDESLGYMAVDSFTLAPMNDGETDPAKKKFELKGKLVGYFLPASPAAPTSGAGSAGALH